MLSESHFTDEIRAEQPPDLIVFFGLPQDPHQLGHYRFLCHVIDRYTAAVEYSLTRLVYTEVASLVSALTAYEDRQAVV